MQTESKIARVSAKVHDGHQIPIRRRSENLGLFYAMMWKILRKDTRCETFKNIADVQLIETYHNS